MGKVTKSNPHLFKEEIQVRIKSTVGFWRVQKCLVIWNALVDPRPAKPFRPFLVAYGGKELIEGHSGIFAQELRNFINDYVAMARGNRLLLADPALQHCPGPTQ